MHASVTAHLPATSIRCADWMHDMTSKYLLHVWLEDSGFDKFSIVGCERIGYMLRCRANRFICGENELRESSASHKFRNGPTRDKGKR
jgi:hypothetical protein